MHRGSAVGTGTLTATVIPDPTRAVMVMELRGVLCLRSVPTVRNALHTCLAQCPEAVVVDMADLEVPDRAYLTVFPAVLHRHTGPPVTIALCGADARQRHQLVGPVLGDVRLYATRQEALAAVLGAQPRQLTTSLPPEPSAPGRARRMIADACRRWGAAAVDAAATVIVSELVSNAVQHARTGIRVTVGRRGGHLCLAVHDDDPATPRPSWQAGADAGSLCERGRGLGLVDSYATAWGTQRTGAGKVVWATLLIPDDSADRQVG